MACFLLGLFIYLVEGYVNIICCKVCNGDSEAFIVNRQLRSIGEVIYATTMTATNNSIPIAYIMGGLLLFCVPALLGIKDWDPVKEPEDSTVSE